MNAERRCDVLPLLPNLVTVVASGGVRIVLYLRAELGRTLKHAPLTAQGTIDVHAANARFQDAQALLSVDERNELVDLLRGHEGDLGWIPTAAVVVS